MRPIYDDYTRRPEVKEKLPAPPQQGPKIARPPAAPFQPPLPPRPPARPASPFVPPLPPRPPAVRQPAPTQPVIPRKPAPPKALAAPLRPLPGANAPRPQAAPPLPAFRQPVPAPERRQPAAAEKTQAVGEPMQKKKRYTNITQKHWDDLYQWWAERTYGVDSPQAEVERADRWRRETMAEIGEEAFARIFATEPDTPQGILMQAWAYDDAKEARRRELEAQAAAVAVPAVYRTGMLGDGPVPRTMPASPSPSGGKREDHMQLLSHPSDDRDKDGIDDRLRALGPEGEAALRALEGNLAATDKWARQEAQTGIGLADQPQMRQQVFEAMGSETPYVMPPYGLPADADPQDVEEAVASTEAMIEEFRQDGMPTASRFLQHFLNGNGEAIVISAEEALAFEQVREMETTVQSYFGDKLMEAGNPAAAQILALEDGETMTLQDQWENNFSPAGWSLALRNVDYENSFGSSTLTGTSHMNVTRHGDQITFEGPVFFDLFDVYDFNEGGIKGWLAADQITLQRSGEGRPFRSGASWLRHVTGTARIENGRVVDVELHWSEAEVGEERMKTE